MSTREERIMRLTERRRADGARKKAAALAAIDDLLRAGQSVSFAAVQRSARVSSWFVYNNAEIRSAIEAARALTPDRPAPAAVSHAGLRADLALARAEVRQLRDERDRLLKRVRRGLGGALESHAHEGHREKVHDLERQCNLLNSELHAARADLARSQESVQLLSEELEASRNAVRRMMRASAKTTDT